MFFDGHVLKEGSGAGIWINSPNGHIQVYCLNLYFDFSNNENEYEGLFIGLNILESKELKGFIFLETWSSL